MKIDRIFSLLNLFSTKKSSSVKELISDVLSVYIWFAILPARFSTLSWLLKVIVKGVLLNFKEDTNSLLPAPLLILNLPVFIFSK